MANFRYFQDRNIKAEFNQPRPFVEDGLPMNREAGRVASRLRDLSGAPPSN